MRLDYVGVFRKPQEWFDYLLAKAHSCQKENALKKDFGTIGRWGFRPTRRDRARAISEQFLAYYPNTIMRDVGVYLYAGA
jgi:hypothetical protein